MSQQPHTMGGGGPGQQGGGGERRAEGMGYRYPAAPVPLHPPPPPPPCKDRAATRFTNCGMAHSAAEKKTTLATRDELTGLRQIPRVSICFAVAVAAYEEADFYQWNG